MIKDYGEFIIESPKHGTFTVLYDLEDEDKIAPYKWRVQKGRNTFYVQIKIPHPDGGWYHCVSNGKQRRRRRQTRLAFHRFIMNPPKGMMIDHINGNGLDNRKENLRIVTSAENSRNKGKFKNNTSGFKGVYYMKKSKKMINERSKPWMAGIRHNKKDIHIGYFSTPEEAARAYDARAKEIWDIVNPERQLNFPDEKKFLDS